MARSKYKTSFFLKLFEINPKKTRVSKKLFLSYYLADKLLKIYNGKKDIFLQINYSMLNYRIGEYIISKKIVIHGEKKK